MARKYEEEDDSGASIVCLHVACDRKPILLAFRDEPTRPEDSGWQFLCNNSDDEPPPKVWSINDVLEYEPTLLEFINSPPGTQVFRQNESSPWQLLKPTNSRILP